MTELGADTDPFLLHIYAARAEKKRALISRRTKDALSAAKARGIVIGGLRDKGRELQAEAFERAEALRPVFAELADMSANAMANELNRRGVSTPRAALGMRARLFGFGVGWERCREALSCVACGSADDVQHHPLVSGNEEDWNLITLCPRCYDKLLRNGVSNPSQRTRKACSRRSTSAVAGKERHDAELAGDPALAGGRGRLLCFRGQVARRDHPPQHCRSGWYGFAWLCQRHPMAAVFLVGFLRGLLGSGR